MTLRFGSPADQRPLARLAELGSSTPPAQPVLLAEVDGQLRAALALTAGTVLADPLHPTADLADLREHEHANSTPPPESNVPAACSLSRLRGLAWR